ncbi:zinc-binding dehydrogenase [Helcobacillus sp. ACRRO]|uniref:zinc-binding dehydrogenase n=1 Tax=Helcobacillus sp. ACRRO TaxID=2918202 RepID=UPI001EF72841|nr:zinc-binding dehydrogenase [Helcobacillus sp. ACRRO]MCG7427640.1 zinc-binding dehydrogenase [Helcobacillus sp. ACRRO]
MRTFGISDRSLHLIDAPEPTPAAGEVLVDVHTIGVNRADVAEVAGAYPPPPFLTPLRTADGAEFCAPGVEIAGTRRDTGEEVVALVAGNGYAEVVAVEESALLPLPQQPTTPADGIADGDGPADGNPEATGTASDRFAFAASVLEAAATVVSNLHLETQVRAGERVLIHGATGSVGLTAVQFAKARGAHVTAIAGSDTNAALLRRIGADVAFNRHDGDVFEQIAAGDGPRNFDVILDVLGGGDALEKNVGALSEYGRLVIIAVLAGATGTLPVMQVMLKKAHIIGTTLRSRRGEAKARVMEAVRSQMWPLIQSGQIRVPIRAEVPFEDAAAAHQILRDGGHLGKVVLRLR